MGSTIIVLTFDEMDAAEKALKTLKDWQKQDQVVLGDAAVVVKDEHGKVKAKDLGEFTAKRGAVAGGVAGVVVGLMLGGPIGGALLGAAAGAYAGKKVDLGISNDKIEAVSESMENASSAIFAEFKSGNKDLIAAGIRRSGGTVHELSITDDAELNLQDISLKADLR